MKALTAVRVGCKVRCFIEDKADSFYGIAEELRWRVGDEFIVTDIHIAPYGTFLYNYKGQNLNIKRAEFVDNKMEENLESIRLLSIDIGEARRINRIYSQFIGEHEDKERRELWAWLEKEGKSEGYEHFSECAIDFAGNQKDRLYAMDVIEKIEKEFEQSRSKPKEI